MDVTGWRLAWVTRVTYPNRQLMRSNGGRGGAILLAGGRGARAGFSANKAYVPIGGQPMISHSLRILDHSPWVVLLVLVIRPEDRRAAEQVVEQVGVTTPWLMAAGGESRHASERRGLEALSGEIAQGRIDLVAIHDGARPFVSSALLHQLFRDAKCHGGAVPTLPVEAPTHRLTGQGEIAILNQERLHRAQTPQVFAAQELLTAYRRAEEAGFEGVDTAETVERFSDLKQEPRPETRATSNSRSPRTSRWPKPSPETADPLLSAPSARRQTFQEVTCLHA